MDVTDMWAKGMWRMDNMRNDLNKCGLEDGDTKNGRIWRRTAQNPDLASHLNEGEEEEEYI